MPCTLPHICRSLSSRGRQIFGTTQSASTSPGPDCPRSTASRPQAPVATGPQAPVVDGPRAPGGQGDPVQGGVGVGLAQVVAGRHGHHQLARHMPRGGASLAAGACRTSRAPRALSRPGPMGRIGISLPCGTWSWSPEGCRAPSASLSLAPLWSRGGGGQRARGAGTGGPVCLQACEWALAGADRGVADWGGGDGDHGWGLWAECAHELEPAEAGVGGRGMACHARPCGEAAEDGGG